MAQIVLPVTEMAARYLEGASTIVLAAAYGVGRTTVGRRLVGAGVVLRGPGRQPELPLPMDEISARYRAGESTGKLGQAFGANARTIGRRLKAAGVEMRVPRRGAAGAYKRGGPLCHSGSGYLYTYDREHKHCSIHRACWEARAGTIPSGYVIHHLNFDPLDNRIGNLACMLNSTHLHLHKKEKRRAA